MKIRLNHGSYLSRCLLDKRSVWTQNPLKTNICRETQLHSEAEMRAIEGEETLMFGMWQWERGRKQPAHNKKHAVEVPLHQFHTRTEVSVSYRF